MGKIKAFDGPADGENPNGFRRIGASGIGKGGVGDHGDEGSQFHYDSNIAGAPWAPPDELSPWAIPQGRVRKR